MIFSKYDIQIIYFFNIGCSEEFTSIAKWVAGCDIDPHIIEVIYALLDNDGDRNLSIEEFRPVLFQWRKSRGFQHQTIEIGLGQLKI